MDSKRRRQLEEQLSAYLDDELSPEQRRQVEAFLEQDAGARRLLAELRATAEALHALPRARASEDLMEALRTRLERRALLGEGAPAGGAAVTRFRFHWLAAAAAVAMAFFGLYMFWLPSSPQPAASPPQFAWDFDAGADRAFDAREPRTPSAKPAASAESGQGAISRGFSKPQAGGEAELRAVEQLRSTPTGEQPVAVMSEGRRGREELSEALSQDTGRAEEPRASAAADELAKGTEKAVVELTFADAAARERAVSAIRARYSRQAPADAGLRKAVSAGCYYVGDVASRSADIAGESIIEKHAEAPELEPSELRIVLARGDSVSAAVERLRSDAEPVHVAIVTDSARRGARLAAPSRRQSGELHFEAAVVRPAVPQTQEADRAAGLPMMGIEMIPEAVESRPSEDFYSLADVTASQPAAAGCLRVPPAETIGETERLAVTLTPPAPPAASTRPMAAAAELQPANSMGRRQLAHASATTQPTTRAATAWGDAASAPAPMHVLRIRIITEESEPLPRASQPQVSTSEPSD